MAQTSIPGVGNAEMGPIRRDRRVGRGDAAHARKVGADSSRETTRPTLKPSDVIQRVAEQIAELSGALAGC